MLLFLLKERLAIILQHLVDRCLIPVARDGLDGVLASACRVNEGGRGSDQLLERGVVADVGCSHLENLSRGHVEHHAPRRLAFRARSLRLRVLRLVPRRDIILHLDSLLRVQL